jgi:thymidylate kinase
VSQATSQFITAAFHAWRRAEIDFLVLRNYESLPESTTNEIDVLVGKDGRARAEKILLSTAEANGFRLHNRAEFATLALYFSRPESGEQVHFDLFAALKWRGFDFLRCQDFLTQKILRGDLAIPHPAHEAATNLLASFIFIGQVKPKYRDSIAAAFRAEPETVINLLAQSYGVDHARAVVTAAQREEWPRIEKCAGKLRRTLILRQLAGSPLRTLGALFADGARLLNRFFRKPGLAIVLCGADGSGKSTVAPKVIEMLSGTFSPQKGRHIHWKPRVFSSEKSEVRGAATDPHRQQPRNWLVSHVYFKLHWLEFFIGWFLRICPVLFRGGLVLIDRYYYDFFVDQRRYRLRVPRLFVRWGCFFLPKPDLAFLLDAPAEILQARKQEVPLQETARQVRAYRELFQTLPNGVIVDATKTSEEVAFAIRRSVLDFLAERVKRRRR